MPEDEIKDDGQNVEPKTSDFNQLSDKELNEKLNEVETESTSNQTNSQPEENEPVTAEPAALPLAPKKSRKKLWIAVTLAAVLVILGAGAALAYSFWYQNPDKVLTDAFVKTINSKTVQLEGNLTVSSDTGSGKSSIDVRMNSDADRANGMHEADVTIDYQGEIFRMKASVIYDENSNTYFKVSNLKEIFTRSGFDQMAPEAADELVDAINDKWVKISSDDYKNFSTQFAGVKSCTDKVLRESKDDDKMYQEVADIYVDNRFVVVEKYLGAKDGNLGYELEIDDAKLKEFVSSLNQTSLLKELQKCDKDQYTLSVDDMKNTTEPEQGVTESNQFWISRWGHEIKNVKYSTDGKSTKADLDMRPVFNKPTNLKAPTDFITISELQTKIEAVLKDYGEQQTQVTM